ncbi:Isochorismatase-like protein [Mycena maculata]|uniref:Isochorismatase-like protein n=1 Tax=Mycena maculata TaxID=230809 RepID=A0AAD7JEF7_9AGAR|nr:Isochorismatase-like protein [Mycena maculata]
MSPSTYLVPSLPDTALIVIDAQQGLNYRAPEAHPALTCNLSIPRPILPEPREIHTQLGIPHHQPPRHAHHVNTTDPESLWYEKTRPAGVLPLDYVEPQGGEPALLNYDKSSAFGAVLVTDGTTSLVEVLAAQGIKTVILVGISSPHCVSSTARSASDRGFRVVVVGDATATYAEEVVDFGGAEGDVRTGRCGARRRSME